MTKEHNVSARHLLVYLAIKHAGDWGEIRYAIHTKEYVSVKEIERIAELISEDDYITIVDETYPDELKKADWPPFVLFRNKGDVTTIPPLSLDALSLA